ncbi:MAG: signal peptidase I [Thermocrinis sp.]|jgi:signal peptidase I|nr:signal peptidase I [Thermocrinis sp.]
MRFWESKYKWVFASVIFGLLFFWLSPVKVVYTMDYSLPYKWWLWSEIFFKIQKGDYVEFAPPVENEYTKGKILVKRVVCMPKETLKTVGLNYYCNGVYLGRARTQDSKGRPVSLFKYEGEIPNGCYFVMGEAEKSYDSRYFGFVCNKHIRAKLFPLAEGPNLDKFFLVGGER